MLVTFNRARRHGTSVAQVIHGSHQIVTERNTLIIRGACNEIPESEGFYPYRAADRRRDHWHYRGDCGPGSAAGAYVRHRGVGNRIAAGREQRAVDVRGQLREW